MTSFGAVADTGFVVALLNRLDVQHEPVKTIYEQSCLLKNPCVVETPGTQRVFTNRSG